MKGKHLITTDNWFYAPNGRKYRAVYGDVEILEDTFLGIKTNRMSTNWFAKVSGDSEHVILAGCQIHYAVKTDREPKQTSIKETAYSTEANVIVRDNEIYVPE